MPEPFAPAAEITAPRWKDRVEEPGNRFYRYPLARLLVRWLIHTPVTPNQVTLIQPVLAAASAFLIARGDYPSTVAAVALYEVRSVLDCADGTLARAKKMVSDTGHAMDAFADWVSVVLLYVGITVRFYNHAPTESQWPSSLQFVPWWAILLIAIAQAAIRSFGSDFYVRKFGSIFEQGHDAPVDDLRERLLSHNNKSFFAKFELFIGRCGQLAMEGRWFDPKKHTTSDEEIRNLQRNQFSGTSRFVASLWSISNGDAFLTMVMLTALLDVLWQGQVFFALIGPFWIFSVILISRWFAKKPASSK